RMKARSFTMNRFIAQRGGHGRSFQPAVSQGFQPEGLAKLFQQDRKTVALPIGNRRYSRLETLETRATTFAVRALVRCILGSVTLLIAVAAGLANEPLRLHPDNPHYFRWRGKPTVIITSGEHYGAVLNLDFDYKRYLDTLAKDKLNGTRLWSGAYAETGGDFKIAGNTLSSATGRFIAPWARSDQPGYADGGNKFDLMRWDDAFFARLKDFVGYASRRGIVVEVNLFCPMYEESMWAMCPMNARNNIN